MSDRCQGPLVHGCREFTDCQDHKPLDVKEPFGRLRGATSFFVLTGIGSRQNLRVVKWQRGELLHADWLLEARQDTGQSEIMGSTKIG